MISENEAFKEKSEQVSLSSEETPRTISSVCPKCLKYMKGKIMEENGKTVVKTECEDHGEIKTEVPENTVRRTVSLCPECLERIPANLVEEKGQILMKKSCPEHGECQDIVFSDSSIWKKFMKEFHTGTGIEKPQTQRSKGCPFDCGLCEEHKTSTVLANIDVTNRCNMNCPICFANANDAGYVFEPSTEQVEEIYKTLANQKPRCSAVQFAGGEPTVRGNLPELIRMAKEDYGFKQIMIASNGVRISRDYEFVKDISKAGASTIYLQFDGVTPEPYKEARGFNALPIKKKALKNLRKAREEFDHAPNVVLVPTVVKGVNDHQIGEIIKFAAENNDIVKAVNFQPVSFTGRIDTEELKEKRYTVTDLFKDAEEQTDGAIEEEDWVTISALHRILDYLKQKKDENAYPELSTHPVCGSGTYVWIDEDSEMTNLNDMIDIEGVLDLFSGEKELSKRKLLLNLHKIIKPAALKKYRKFFQILKEMLTKGSFEAAARFHNNVLFIGNMHFQDPYNFDEERIQRCCIHYATPDGKLIPFCSYNTLHRKKIEEEFSRPLEEEEKWEGHLKPK